MKIFVYSYREFDEDIHFKTISAQYGVEISYCKEAPTLENAYLAKGAKYISIITTKIDAALVRKFKELGVEMISTRTIGYDHIDVEEAKKVGMMVSNATYSPNSVADYALMLMLMSTRKMKYIMEKAAIRDFSLPGNIGKELPGMTIGIIGTGKIGETLIRHLSGFGCKIYAYDKIEKDSVKPYAKYTSLDTIYETCDLISLHIPAGPEVFHMIDDQVIQKMKPGVILINTARGSLIDSKAMIRGIKDGKIGAAALDVVENEFDLYYYDKKSAVMDNDELAILKSFPNVIVTPHMAFYTDEAIHDMVYSSIASCVYTEKGEKNPWLVLSK